MRYVILSAIIILIILFVYPYYSIMKTRSAKSHHYSVPKDSWGQIELNLFNYVKHLSDNIGSRSFFEPSKIGDSRVFARRAKEADMDTLNYQTMAELVKGLVHTAKDLCKV